MNNDELAAKIDCMTVFASGLSRINDFRTYSRMGAPCGIVATEASAAVLHALTNHNEVGLPVFIDNNAFGTFKQALKTGATCAADFDRVFKVFDKIIASVERTNLVSLVMPDIIGDQTASLDLIGKYREKILAFIRAGADVLIPLQGGKLSLAEVHERICEVLGTSNWRASIPCNVKRMLGRELFEMAFYCKPDRMHLLGVAGYKKLLPLVKLILEAHPSADITADANRMRSIIDEDFTRKVKERREEEGHEIAVEIADCGYGYGPDFTEFLHDIYNTPAYLTREEATQLASMITPDTREQNEFIHAATRTDRAPYREDIDYEECGETYCSFLGQWLEANTYGDYAYHIIFDFLFNMAQKHVPVQIRSEEITRAEKGRRARRTQELTTLTRQGELAFE